MANARWNLAVSEDIDRSLRTFLAAQGRGRKGDLSQFIEEAVRAEIFERSAGAAKAANAGLAEGDLDAIILESLNWARKS